MLGFKKEVLIKEHVYYIKNGKHFYFASNCGIKTLRLFNIQMNWQRNGSFLEYEFRFYIGKNYVFEINGNGEFNLKKIFSVEAKARKTRAKVSFTFLGYYNFIRFGHTVWDEHDGHADKYYYCHYDKEKDIDEYYTDDSLQNKYVATKARKNIYKEFYTSKLIKIYNKDWLNCLYGRTIEFALPFFHYLKFDFKKPFYNREWLGFRFVTNFEYGLLLKLTLMLFKHEFRVVLAKNKLNRISNLSSISAIKRILTLYKRHNQLPQEYWNYISIMLNNKKSAPFIYMLKNSSFMEQDLKKYLLEDDFEEICPAHNFCKPIFDSICNKIIELDIPIDTWEYLTDDNSYIEPTAKKQLFEIRDRYIRNKQNQYNFTLKGAANHTYWNGYSIVDYPYKDKKGELHTRQYVIDSNNNCINVSEKFWVYWVTKNNKLICYYQNVEKYGYRHILIDFDEKVIIKPFDYDDFEIIDLGTPGCSEKFFKVKKGNKYGLLDDSNGLLIKPQYFSLEEAGNGFLLAQKSKYKYGIIDILGNILIPFNYNNIYTIGTKYFTAKIKGKWGLYDYDNNNIISPQYQAFYFYEKYGVAKFNGKWGIIDINNNCITGFIFDEADVNVDDIRWLPLGYDYVLDRQKTKRYAARKCLGHKSDTSDVNVRKNKKWGTYSLVTGKQVLPLEYDEICYFYDGICRARKYKDKNNKSEMLVTRNNEVLVSYDMARNEYCFWEYPYEGMWKCKRSGKYEFRLVNNLNNCNHKSFDEAMQYNEGLVAVSLHNHWGFMDKNENIVIPIIFDEVSNFADGRAFVSIKGKSGLIDKNGKEIKIFEKKEIK